jgi:hypothetical protein
MVGLAILSMRPRDRAPEPPDWPFLEHLPPETADAVGVLFGTRRGSLARIIAGSVCIAAGLAAFFVSVDSWRALQGGIIGAVVVIVGFALIARSRSGATLVHPTNARAPGRARGRALVLGRPRGPARRMQELELRAGC